MKTARPPEQTNILVHAVTAQVYRDRFLVRLTQREAEIVAALAAQAFPTSVDHLSGLLFPDRGSARANNMVKVNVYRLRRRLGQSFIVYREGGYAFGPGVSVDKALAHEFLCSFAAGRCDMEANARDRMLDLARSLRREPPAVLLDCEWYPPVALAARRLGHDVAMQIARSAARRGDVRTAIAIARELTYEDSCDEEAWELLIRTLLCVGETVAARRGYRFFSAAMKTELDAVPSASIRRLVEIGQDAVGA